MADPTPHSDDDGGGSGESDSKSEQQPHEQFDQTSTFLNIIPAEIRNQIYELAVPHGEIFNTASTQKIAITDEFQAGQYASTKKTICRTIQKRRPFRRVFGLTQVCRQMRKETLELAYASNTYVLRVVAHDRRRRPTPNTISDAYKWLTSRPPEVLPLISKVIIQLWDVQHPPSIQGCQFALFDVEQETKKPIWLVSASGELSAPVSPVLAFGEPYFRQQILGRMTTTPAIQSAEKLRAKIREPGEELFQIIWALRTRSEGGKMGVYF